MTAITPPPTGDLDRGGKRERRDLQQFLLYLGSGLTAAGEAVNRIEDRLQAVAAAYGAPQARISVTAGRGSGRPSRSSGTRC